MNVEISQAHGPGDIEEIRRLFVEYAESLGLQGFAPHLRQPDP